jgi:ribonucleoside-diphosphate reductase alpha chain
MRRALEGARLFEVNPLFEKIAKERKFYSAEMLERVARTGSLQKLTGIPGDIKRIFKTALDIKPEWHVRMQAVFQKYTDNAVSKTINLPEKAKLDDVKIAYEMAYKLKCKGITVYRYGSKEEQVLYVGKQPKEEYLSASAEYSGGCPGFVCPH